MPRRNSESANRPVGPRREKREIVVKKECRLCEDDVTIDYKQTELLKKFMTERGKILPRRVTGNCAYCQRALARAIKRARVMLLVR
jgi:small subunit ribosomal protein S18